MEANFLHSSKIIKTAILLLCVHIGIINLVEENSKILEKRQIKKALERYHLKFNGTI